jgi:hypothetical protein
MLAGKISARSPSARLLGIARLEKFALHWNKRSKDGSGKFSISETGKPLDIVWGVVYEMSRDDKRTLDKFEGLGNGYAEREVIVLLNGSATSVPAYYATNVARRNSALRLVQGTSDSGCPSAWTAGGVHRIAESDSVRCRQP